MNRSSPSTPFIERFHTLADDRSPFCLGVDPSTHVLERWGLPDDVNGLLTFCNRLAQWIGATLALVKPQVAYFERFGPPGLSVLQRLAADMRDRGTLVLLDAKRGDIGPTNEAYAQALFDRNCGYDVDAVTMTPFLGFDALEPVIAAAERAGGYVFTVVASSNPEGRALQQARTEDGITISEVLVNAIARRNTSGSAGGVCGAVIGATRDDVGRALMERLGSALILVPGLGAQGANYGALAKFPCPRTVIPTAARAVLSTAGDEATFRGTLARQCNDSMRLRD